MKRRTLLLGGSAAATLASLALLGDALVSRRYAATAPPSIGILSGGGGDLLEDHLKEFRQGLRDLGWRPGENLAILHGDVGSDIGQLPRVANELTAAGVRLILATGPSSVTAIMQTNLEMPVVLVGLSDPVQAGLVNSFAEPGGSVTGVVGGSAAFDPKRVEILGQVVPAAKRLALVANLSIAGQKERASVIGSTAAQLGLELRVFDVREPAQIEPTFASVRGWGADVLMSSSTNPMANARDLIVSLAAHHRLPAMYSNLDWVRAGGLIGLGPDTRAIYRRAATYVDRILRGAVPAQIPVERSSVFEFLVNRTALADLGLTIPPSLAPLVSGWVG